MTGHAGVRGWSAEAAPLFEKALGILERSLGPEHPHTVLCREAALG